MESKNRINDADLIARAKLDPAHFREIYDLYFEDIFRFIIRRVNESEAAKDITQQVFLKALLGLKTYVYRDLPFSSFLYRIAANECNQFFRDSTKVRFVAIDSEIQKSFFTEIESDRPSIEQDLEKLKRSLERLSLKELLLIELRFFEKKSFREIGFILQITENLTKVRTYRLLKKIKTEMEMGHEE